MTMDLMIIASLAIIIAVLIFIASRIGFVKEFFVKRKKEQEYIDAKLIKEFELRRKRQFFLKFANIDEENQTVTFTNAVLQALVTLRQREAAADALALVATSEASAYSDKQANYVNGNVVPDNLAIAALDSDCDIDCDYGDLSTGRLARNHENYETLVEGIIGRGRLAKVCKCPGDGGGYCNWAADMLTQFIVDKSLWNLVSIQIIDCQGKVIATTSENNVQDIGDGTFALFTMSDQDAILALTGRFNIVFTWLEEGTEVVRCINLVNVIEGEVNDDTSGFTFKAPAKPDGELVDKKV